MSDGLVFPNSVDEFMNQYSFIDEKKIYTNGSVLIPVFRIEQWFKRKGHWILKDDGKLYCSQCGAVLPFVTHLKFGMSGTYTTDTNIDPTPFCPNCGIEMEEY